MENPQKQPIPLCIVLICKRLYTNRDLIDDRFGRLFHIPVALAKLGHKVHVLALDYRQDRPREQVEINEVRFISVPAASVTDVALMTTRLYSELKRIDPDVLLASADIYIGGLTALFSSLLKKPWLFDVYDDYRCFASAHIPGMKNLFWKLLSSADHVLVASNPLADLASRSTVNLTVIENGVDLDLFRPLEKSACRKQLKIPDTDIVIGFFGSMVEKRGIKILLQAARTLLSRYPQLRLLLAGKNGLSLDVNESYIDYRGVVSQTSLPAMINACDVVTIPYQRDPQVDVSSPCKVAEYLACKVPVVVTDVSDMAEIFSPTPDVVAAPGDVQSLTETLIQQIEHPVVSPLPDGLAWADLTRLVEQALQHASGV